MRPPSEYLGALRKPAGEPAIYFLGVHTSGSVARQAFPHWTTILRTKATLIPVDLARPSNEHGYMRFVRRLRADPMAIGAQITSHKVALFRYAASAFQEIGEDAAFLGEIGAIIVKAEGWKGISPDVAALRTELPAMLRNTDWTAGEKEVVILGAGGAGLAIAWALAHLASLPHKVTLTDTSRDRLHHARRRLRRLRLLTPHTDWHVRAAAANDDAVARAAPGALIVNATGLGKDRPGSPITPQVPFPARTIAWDLNYRGQLAFLEHARSQSHASSLTVVDGWRFFVRNWFVFLCEATHATQTPARYARFCRASNLVRAKGAALGED